MWTPAAVGTYVRRRERRCLNLQGVEYAITRTLDGVQTVFFLYFVKDPTGVWRLESM